MAGFTNAHEVLILDHVFSGAGTSVAPTNIFVGLYTTAPTADDGTGSTEVSGNAYARVSTGAADWNSASAGDPTVIDNANAITFPTASGGNWGTVVAFGLFDASTAGNLIAFGTLTTSKAVNDGDTAEFAAGALDVKLGDPGDSY